MLAVFSVTAGMVALLALPVFLSITLIVLVLSSLTFWLPPRERMIFWVWTANFVSASSGATSNRRFLRARIRRPPDGLRMERPCQRHIRTPGCFGDLGEVYMRL